MKRVLLVTAAMLLGACQQSPLQSDGRVSRVSTLGRASPFSLPLPFPPGTQQIPGMATYHCDGQGHNSGKGYPKCQSGIPLVVLDAGLDKNNQPLCAALLPYNELVVHTGRKPNGKAKEAVVVWQIVGSSDYEFSSATDGIALRPPSGSPLPLPSDVYDDKGFEGGGKQKYRWRARDEAPTRQKFNHDAAVVHKSGSPKCEPMDPIIINQDN